MKIINIEQLKTHYGLEDETLLLYISNGLPYLNIGGRMRFIYDEVAKWLHQFVATEDASFRDEKGRGLDEYLTLADTSSLFEIPESELLVLSLTGMPHLVFRGQVYCHQDDMLSYFRKQVSNMETKTHSESYADSEEVIEIESAFSAEETPTEKETHFIVVDGSYLPKNRSTCAGVIWKRPDGTIHGYSKKADWKAADCNACELWALLEALRLARDENLENVVIASDRTDLVCLLQTKNLNLNKWKGVQAYSFLTKEIVALVANLGDKVTFVYAKTPELSTFHDKAHAFSRLHVNRTRIQISDVRSPQDGIGTIPPTKETVITYAGLVEGRHAFNVRKSNTSKTSCRQETHVISAMLSVAGVFLPCVGKRTIRIGSIPNFSKEMESFLSCPYSSRLVTNIKRLYDKMVRTNSYVFEDDFHRYFYPLAQTV